MQRILAMFKITWAATSESESIDRRSVTVENNEHVARCAPLLDHSICGSTTNDVASSQGPGGLPLEVQPVLDYVNAALARGAQS